MRLYKRGKIYWAQFHGKRVSLGVSDPKAAELAFKELQRQHADPAYRASNEAATLSAALKTFTAAQAQRGRAQGTLVMYDRHIGHLARVLGDSTPLARIDAREIDHYLEVRHREGAARQTQWKELCTLRGALKLARRHKLYPFALDEVMPLAFEGRESAPGERHLLMPAVKRLLTALPPERAAVVAFIVATGSGLSRGLRRNAARRHRLQGGSRARAREQNGVPGSDGSDLGAFSGALEACRKGMPFQPWGNVRRDLEVACRRAGLTA